MGKTREKEDGRVMKMWPKQQEVCNVYTIKALRRGDGSTNPLDKVLSPGERRESDGRAMGAKSQRRRPGLSLCSSAVAAKERAGIMGLEFEQTERRRALSREYIGFNTKFQPNISRRLEVIQSRNLHGDIRHTTPTLNEL